MRTSTLSSTINNETNNEKRHSLNIIVWVEDNSPPYEFVVRSSQPLTQISPDIHRYAPFYRLCTGDGALSPSIILLEVWDGAAGDWTVARLSETLLIARGTTRIVMRVAGTHGCIGLGHEIQALEEEMPVTAG